MIRFILIFLLFCSPCFAGTLNLNDNKMEIIDGGWIRSKTSSYARYYHLPLFSLNPGASGATLVAPSASTLGGWRITNVSNTLQLQTDVHSDWDGASDPVFEIKFCCNVNNTGGAAGDTVDLRIVFYYKKAGETANKTQTVEVPTTIGASPQYKQFKAVLPINWDETSNNIAAGDTIVGTMNLETDTSEVDDIVITDMSFYYLKTHVGLETGDA